VRSKKYDPRDCLTDILENIGHIERYITGIDRESFEKDRRTADAVERCLERICEAAFRLGDWARELMPQQPWLDIRGMGNRLRHAYDRIEVDVIWLTISDRLPSLKEDVTRALADLGPRAL